MRLIDLDQTVIFTITDETQGGMQYEVQMTIAEVFYKFFDGVQPAIVDAIPVEWLKLHAREYYEDWGEEPITVENALKMWQKKQGAR